MGSRTFNSMELLEYREGRVLVVVPVMESISVVQIVRAKVIVIGALVVYVNQDHYVEN